MQTVSLWSGAHPWDFFQCHQQSCWGSGPFPGAKSHGSARHRDGHWDSVPPILPWIPPAVPHTKIDMMPPSHQYVLTSNSLLGIFKYLVLFSYCNRKLFRDPLTSLPACPLRTLNPIPAVCFVQGLWTPTPPQSIQHILPLYWECRSSFLISQQTSPIPRPTWYHALFIHSLIHSFSSTLSLSLPSPSTPGLKPAFSNTQWTASKIPHPHSGSLGSKQNFLSSIPSTHPNIQLLSAPLSLLLTSTSGSKRTIFKTHAWTYSH